MSRYWLSEEQAEHLRHLIAHAIVEERPLGFELALLERWLTDHADVPIVLDTEEDTDG